MSELGHPTTTNDILERELIAATLDAVAALVVVLDREGRIVRFNRACEEATGYALHEVRGRHVWDLLLVPEEAGPVKTVFGRLRSSRCPDSFENSWITKDGDRRLIAWSNTVVPDDEGQVEYVIGTGIDITERRRAERALQESEHRYQALTDISPVGIFRTDASGQYLYVNGRWCEISGLAPGDALGDGWAGGLHPEDRARVLEAWRRAIREDGAFESEYRFLRRDGSTSWVYGQAVACKAERGRVTGFVGAVTDITERKLADEEKAKLREHLHSAQKMEAVGQLASGVAHDFNNLLTVILCSTARLRREWPTADAAGLAVLGGIEEAAHQATRVTRSLLTFAREVPAEKKPIRLCSIIEEGARLLRRTLPPSIELIVEMDRQPPLWINADTTQVQQILLNLALNARDALPGGGTLRIAATHAAEKDLRNWEEVPVGEADERTDAGRRHAGYVCLGVSDNGAGMLPEIRARIFEPFFTTKPRGQGTGLGLAMVHGLVKEHGGRIFVKTTEGRGTTFRVLFPRTRPPAESDVGPAPKASRRGRGELVLLALADSHLRGIVAMTLESLGYEVVQARDGAAAGRRFEKVRVILLDVDLPSGVARDDAAATTSSAHGGLDWLREIRKAGVRTPVVIISAGATEGLDGQRDAWTWLLHKPFKVPELGYLMSDILSEGRDPEDES